MFKLFKKVLSLLAPLEKRNLALLCGFMVCNALLEVFGIASIAPLIAVITNPDSLQTMPFINEIYNSYGFDNYQEFSVLLGCLVLCIIILTNASMLLTNYLSIRFSNNREYTIGRRLLSTYLFQPYSFFLGRHSTELLRNVFNEVAYIVSNVIIQCLNLVSRSISALAIIIFVFIVNPQVTIIMGLILGGAYGFIYFLIKTPLYKLGKENIAMTELKLKSITDSIRIIRDIKMLGAENIFINKFDKAADGYARVRTKSDIISIAPRYIIEVFALSGLIVSIIYLVSNSENSSEVLPILGIYAFASYRLLPALQNIFQALAQIRFSTHSLDIVSEELRTLQTDASFNMSRETKNIDFNDKIALDNVAFSYEDSDLTLSDINIEISKNEKIGIIGESGAGKSTLIDLLVGLSKPTAGSLRIDDKSLEGEDYAGWRQNISYVSQNVYLLDDNIDFNISLAGSDQQIDKERTENARELALVNAFLEEMGEDEDLVTGENGIRLSGGQRQRIGIARALYQDREILVLDEATSALDTNTERKLLDNIISQKDRTIILITHRVQTLKFCDRIYVLENGKIIDFVSYKELEKSCKQFKKLITSSDE